MDLPAGKVVDVPLAQTGEGIAECELLKWYVQQVSELLTGFNKNCSTDSKLLKYKAPFAPNMQQTWWLHFNLWKLIFWLSVSIKN